MIKKILIAVAVLALLGGGGTWYFMNRPVEDMRMNYDPGDYFVTDIKGSRRLLKTDVIIYSSDKNLEVMLTEENHKIRNIIIFTLRSKTEEDLAKADIETTLNKEIIEKLNTEFGTDTFVTIYFNEFVLQ